MIASNISYGVKESKHSKVLSEKPQKKKSYSLLQQVAQWAVRKGEGRGKKGRLAVLVQVLRQ